jgi:hypothetical protein
LFFSQILGHHLRARGQWARAAQQLLDRKLEMLLVGVVRTHLGCTAEPIPSDGPLVRDFRERLTAALAGVCGFLDRFRHVPAGGVRKLPGA